MTRLALGFSLVLCSALGLAVGCGGSTSADGSGGGQSGGTGGTATGGSGNASGGSGNASGTSGSGGGGTSGSGGGTAGTAGTAGTSACSEKGTCTLLPANCCGYCDPNAPLSGYLAVNEKHAASVMEGLCADPVACPDCITQDEPNYLALCRAGQCTPVDLRGDELSACTKDEDCRLRWGSDCCESCGAGSVDDLIVYNKNANLEAEVCSPFGGACPPCAPPPYPSHILPYCDGHCRWTLVGP